MQRRVTLCGILNASQNPDHAGSGLHQGILQTLKLLQGIFCEIRLGRCVGMARFDPVDGPERPHHHLLGDRAGNQRRDRLPRLAEPQGFEKGRECFGAFGEPGVVHVRSRRQMDHPPQNHRRRHDHGTGPDDEILESGPHQHPYGLKRRHMIGGKLEKEGLLLLFGQHSVGDSADQKRHDDAQQIDRHDHENLMFGKK